MPVTMIEALNKNHVRVEEKKKLLPLVFCQICDLGCYSYHTDSEIITEQVNE